MDSPGQWRGEDLLLRCRVKPNARRDAFAGVHGRQVKLSLAAPPVDGKANARAIAFLATAFAVPPSRVQLLRGASGRDKVFLISAPLAIPESLPLPQR
jgi:uncharacterized protein (TIGR00251 family)